MIADNKKAKIYGIITLILFIIFCFIPTTVTYIYSGLDINKDRETIQMISGITNVIVCLLLLLVIIFTILAIYIYFKYRKKTAPINNIIRVLYERYAKGEITKEELEKMKKRDGKLMKL